MLPGLASIPAEAVAAPATGMSVLGIAAAVLMMLVAMLSTVGAVLSFLFTMTLFRIPEEHRKMSLFGVWGIVLPVWGVYWLRRVILALSQSFEATFAAGPDLPKPEGNFGRVRGQAMWLAAVGTHAAALIMLTRNVWVIGAAFFLAIGASAYFTVLYFREVLRIRSLIPDPEQEEIRDYI